MEVIVYNVAFHGGTEVVSVPEIRKGLRNLDFGVGFYATHSREQAVRWAERQRRIRNAAAAVVSRYDVTGLSTSGLAIRSYETPSEDWLDSVVACRRGDDVFAGFDVVTGPVADDNVYATIRLYETGVYTREETIRRLQTEKLFNQIAFKSAAALAYCRFISSEKWEGGPL